MDTSETYIKMCDCEEIQGQSKDKHDRCSFWAKSLITGKHSVWMDLHNPDDTWLPRQDQIQEMLEKPLCFDIRFVHKPNALLYYLAKFQDQHPSIKYETMEQLWLAFYMYEKHGKVWNGDKWVKK